MDDPFSFCIFAAVLQYQPTRNEINMTKSIEELKMILDIATNGGKMEAQNEMLLEKIARMEKEMKRQENELKRQENENKKLRNDLAEKTKECEELEAKIMCDMKMDEQDSNNQGSIVFVNNYYYVLSWPKTVEYVGTLDSNGRVSASHFIHHTLPDGISVQFIKKVDELTKLEARQEKRLADAIEKVAERPTTENHIYPQDGSTTNGSCDMQNPEFKLLPPIQGAPVQQTLQEGGEGNE